jgi:hypothetical protein
LADITTAGISPRSITLLTRTDQHYITVMLSAHACRATRPTPTASRRPFRLRTLSDIFDTHGFRLPVQRGATMWRRYHRISLVVLLCVVPPWGVGIIGLVPSCCFANCHYLSRKT